MANDVATPLPQMDLRDGTVLTVTLDDPAARITRLVIHGWQTVEGAPGPIPVIDDSYLPGAV